MPITGYSVYKHNVYNIIYNYICTVDIGFSDVSGPGIIGHNN